MHLHKQSQFFCAIALVIALSHAAIAVCPNALPADEQLLWDVHNCESSHVSWFRDAYNLKSEHWGGDWGWDKCDPAFAFPKMLNAGYLLAHGIQSDSLEPWHSHSDYSNWANAHGDDFHYKPVDSDENAYAQAFGGLFQTDRVEMYCLGINNSPAARAATLLHEATHVVYWEYKHKNNPAGNCVDDEPCSDDWLFHSLHQYPYGDLRGHKHSMVQIQVEFLCDLSEYADFWVPTTTRQLAKSQSILYMDNLILNPPGWTCGQRRPIFEPPPPECQPGWKCCLPATPPATGCEEECVPESASCQ